MVGADPKPPRRRDSVAEAVVAALMGRVLGGNYGPGSRLPSERDLAADLGVARVSVREALTLLSAWGVVSVVPGSGAAVAPRHAWTMDALGSVMAHLFQAERWSELGRLVSDAIELRRSVVLDVLERSARHLGRGRLDPARLALGRALSAKDREAFVRADRLVIPAVLEAAGMLPSVWLLNSMAGPYLSVVAMIGGGADPRYQDAHLETFEALEERDGAGARARFAKHLRVSDRLLVDSLPSPLKKQLSISRSS